MRIERYLKMIGAEINHITSNKFQLVKAMTYNKDLTNYLVEKEHIGDSDVEALDRLKDREGNAAAVSELLRLLTGRVQSYVDLLGAVRELKQTKAIEILEKLDQGQQQIPIRQATQGTTVVDHGHVNTSSLGIDPGRAQSLLDPEVQKALDFIADKKPLDVVIARPNRNAPPLQVNPETTYLTPQGQLKPALLLNVVDFDDPASCKSRTGSDNSKPKMEKGNPVVGSPECPIGVLLSVLHQDETFIENWSAFATALDIPSVRIKRFRSDLLVDKITHFDLINEVLELWISNEGRNARLAILLLIIEEECAAHHAGSSIRRYFNMASDKSDSITWDDLTPHLQGKVDKSLRNFFPKLDIAAVGPLLKDGLLRHLMKDILLPETIPEPLSYYIYRTVITRNVISTAIFYSFGSHIFLISEIERHELSRFAKDKTTDTSSSQIKQRRLTVKHIILESPIHFNKICGLTDEHVHWLRYENNKLRWVQSRGGIQLVQEHVERNQDELNEEDFCATLKSDSNQPVCISDSPGMGKSVFLAQVGRHLHQLYPERKVVFLDMNELVKKMKEVNINEIVESIKDDSGGGEITMELLLDGFDEVNELDSEFALELLRLIKTSLKYLRLWVTSRPHLLPKLEQTLDTIGFNIQPFSKEDQIRFLTTFWSKDSNELNPTKLEKFASHCLETLSSAVNSSRERDIAGIPLQCRLIGEGYEEEAVSFASGDGVVPEVIITSLSDLYQKLIETKFRKGNPTKLVSSAEGNSLMDMHVKLSLELLFPEKSATLQHFLPQVDMNAILKVGVMESSSTSLASSPSSLRFVHRTFAEYFVAWFVLDRLMMSKDDDHGNLVDDPAVRFFVLHVLTCKEVTDSYNYGAIQSYFFIHPVICNFVNSMIISNVVPIFNAKISAALADCLSSYDTLNKIARACAVHSLTHLLNLLISIPGIESCKSQVFSKFVLFKTTLDFFKLALAQFEKYVKVDPQMEVEMLNVAVSDSDYAIVEYLLKERKLSQPVREGSQDKIKFLLHNCVEASTKDSSKRLADKIQVLRLLNDINPSLLHMKDIHGRTPLFVGIIHVRLMTELIRLGADINAQNDTGEPVLHLGLRVNTDGLLFEDFHSLLSKIPKEHLKKFVGQKCGGNTPLMVAMQKMDPKPETLDMLKNAGADFNFKVKHGDSILACAVKWRRSEATIRKLIQHGADVHWRKGWRRKTLLHYAVEYGSTDAVKVLSEWIDINVKDLTLRTPSYYS